MSHQIKSVCFDLDDTLYPYEQYARSGLRAAADCLEAETGQQHHEELLEIHFNEEREEGSFDVLLERNDIRPVSVDELVMAFHNATDPLTPYPETEAVLAQLAEEYALGLITDGRGGHGKLRRLGIRDWFESVLVTPTIERSKHDRAVFDRVLSALSVAPESAVYVGDDPRVDFTVPNELGMTTVRLRRGRYRTLEPLTDIATPDHEVQQLDELPDVIGAMTPPERPTTQRRTDVR